MQRDKWILAATLAAAFFIGSRIASNASGPAPDSGSTPQKERIGTYDSRAIAVAYCNTELHKAELGRLTDAMKTAKASGDRSAIKRCEQAFSDAQKLAHRQAFSTHPVDGILAKLEDKLPKIKEAAGVTALISKWDKKALAKHKHAERIDLTQPLVDAIGPNERQRKHAMEIQKVKPISPFLLDLHLRFGGH